METLTNIRHEQLTAIQFVTCIGCGAVQPGGDPWLCRECNESLQWGSEQAQCNRCGQFSAHTRHWFALRPMCDCHLSEAKKRELLRRQQKQQTQQMSEALEAQERELAKQRRSAQFYHASECWDNDNQRCSISLASLPFGFCSVCPRFEKNRPGRKQSSGELASPALPAPADNDPRFGKVEMKEIDCG